MLPVPATLMAPYPCCYIACRLCLQLNDHAATGPDLWNGAVVYRHVHTAVKISCRLDAGSCCWRRGVQAARKERAQTKRATFLGIVQQISEQQGFLGFFAGMRAKIVQSVLAAALMFVLKERLHQLTLKAIRRLA